MLFFPSHSPIESQSEDNNEQQQQKKSQQIVAFTKYLQKKKKEEAKTKFNDTHTKQKKKGKRFVNDIFLFFKALSS